VLSQPIFELSWASLAKPSCTPGGTLGQRAGAPVILACYVGVVIPCRNEGPLVITAAWLGELMVDGLRREPPRVRPQRGYISAAPRKQW